MVTGIIKSETYRYVYTGETVQGSYIMLDKYEMRKAPRENGDGEVW